jgi:2-phosphoglycerate kinase
LSIGCIAIGKALLIAAGTGMGKTAIAREVARRMELNKDMVLGMPF